MTRIGHLYWVVILKLFLLTNLNDFIYIEMETPTKKSYADVTKGVVDEGEK